MHDGAFITERPGVSGGYPVVGNTRIAVRLIVEAYRETGSFERTVQAFPQLTPEQVKAALEYYEQQPEQVDEDIRTNAEALEELESRQWPA